MAVVRGGREDVAFLEEQRNLRRIPCENGDDQSLRFLEFRRNKVFHIWRAGA